MLKLTRLSLFALALLANPAAAACDTTLLFLSDLRVQIEKLTQCVRDQEMAISLQAGEIRLLQKQVDRLEELRDRDSKDIAGLTGLTSGHSKAIFKLFLEFQALQTQKTKPAK
jgi:hypothetical protein